MTANCRGLSVERYAPPRKEAWDRLVNIGKNATFLFHRDYMDYHSDRFKDHSLLIWRGAELLAVFPANLRSDGVLISHQGLTYGGLVFQPDVVLGDVLEVFHAMFEFLHDSQVEKVIYKRIPRFYNIRPDDEVDYALFLLSGEFCERNCALVLSQSDPLPWSKRRQREIAKARRAELRVVEETDFTPFWDRVLIPRLAARFGVKPVHSLDEITLLAARFPHNIRQFSVYAGDQILAGTTIYETPTVAHAQYIAVSDQGQKVGAIDFLFEHLILDEYKTKRYFDLGICNEQSGQVLNHGLLVWKEGFGGRTCVHDFYAVLTRNYAQLERVLSPVASTTSDPPERAPTVPIPT